MAHLTDGPCAFGQPGRKSSWARADKSGVGTAFSNSSRIWYTIRNGVITEIYYPTVDRPQTRVLELAVHDGNKLHFETRDFDSHVEAMDGSPGYRIRLESKTGLILQKEVISDPVLPAVFMRVRVQAAANSRLYILCEPHLEVGGAHNNGRIALVGDKRLLVAEKNDRWLALAVDRGLSRASCGYLGVSDGWTDLEQNGRMEWEFARADDGHIGLTAEVDLSHGPEFTVCLAMGENFHHACTVALQSGGLDYARKRDRFLAQWRSAHANRLPLSAGSCDGGRLYETSWNLLLAHEDKTYRGAFIASLSIPWGECIGDAQNAGGYHLVWTRDMVQASGALLAAGEKETALRSLTYLASSQEASGAFPQNFWIDGRPYRKAIQFDEIAYPMLLAGQLRRAGALQSFDPWPSLALAAAYLIGNGPVTGEERWEESSGFSPSTLAVVIAGLICTAAFARDRGEPAAAQFIEEYADYLRAHVKEWTVTTCGDLLPQVRRYFVRLNPAPRGTAPEPGSVNTSELTLPARKPGEPEAYPARNIVDAGFLQLVRLGVFPAYDPDIVQSLRVVDAVLRVETPKGPCWHRYNHDNYGQKNDGSCFDGTGVGRAWPLLTGERGHYELAAGRDPSPCIAALERFANEGRLLPEQVWDDPANQPDGFRPGSPTGSAVPLLWAHAEYVKLLRSTADGKSFDLLPEVGQRYGSKPSESNLEIWTFRYPTPVMRPGKTVRVFARRSFHLRLSLDNWSTHTDFEAEAVPLGLSCVDVQVPEQQTKPVRFTFFWTDSHEWHGADYSIRVEKDVP